MGSRKPHKAWLMLFGCCMLQGGLGIIHNCRGVFYTPIILDRGFGMGAFTFFVFCFGVCSCVILPFMNGFFRKYDCRLLLGGASVVFALTSGLMGFCNTLPAFYLVGAVQGFAGAFLMFYPVPLILGNWFKKRLGFAVGIATACSGLAGVVGNPLGSAIISRFGWRAGYWVLGVICFLMIVPVSAFLLRLRPEDCGLLPYGHDTGTEDVPEKEKLGVPSSIVKRSPWFWLLIFCGLLAADASGFYAHLSPLGTYAGYGVSTASLLVSAAMVGNVIGKLLLGLIHDRYGLEISMTVGTVSGTVGFILLLLDSVWFRLVGALLFGAVMAMSAVTVTVAIKDIFGRESYGALLPFACIASTFGATFMMMVVGYIVDGFGPAQGYRIGFAIGLGMVVVMGVLLIVAVYKGRKLAAKYAAKERR